MIEALSAAAARDVSRETFGTIAKYVELLKEGASQQNLISPSTLETVWHRHILDSAQLVRFEPFEGASWVDIGSGAGLPGIIVALLVSGPVTLVEPRRLRAGFLECTVELLGLADRVRVEPVKVEKTAGAYDVITARAVAPLTDLLRISQHLSTRKTVWALPKGQSGLTELAEAQRAWQGVFHVEQSVTDEDSYIVLGKGVGKKR